MFYLKECLKLFKENSILGFIFIFSAVAFISVGHQKENLKKQLSLSDKTQSQPYFSALIAGNTNIESVARRMKILPGVVGVKVVSSKSISQEVNTLKKKFGNDVVKGLTSLNYKKIKIELDKGILVKNQSLIKEYLGRLVGKQSVTISSIKTPKGVQLKDKDPLILLLKWGEFYLLAITGGLWLISAFLLLKPLNNSAYIIEKFQRRSKANFKILGSGVAAVALITLGANLAFESDISIFSFLPVVLIVVLTAALTLGLENRFRA